MRDHSDNYDFHVPIPPTTDPDQVMAAQLTVVEHCPDDAMLVIEMLGLVDQ